MEEILINKASLENEIAILTSLKENFSGCSSYRNEEEMCGAGNVTECIHALEKEQMEIIKSFDFLLENTIAFLKNVLDSIVEADAKAESEF